MAQSYLEFQIGQKKIYFTITNIILLLAKNNTIEFLTKMTLVIISLHNYNFFYHIQGILDDVQKCTICIIKYHTYIMSIMLIAQYCDCC